MATPTTLPASFTSGQVLTATQMNDLRGAFRVLQVVSADYATQVQSSSNAYADTGLTATITPSATSSKILVIVSQAGCGKDTSNTYLKLRLMRGATEISTFEAYGGFDGANATQVIGSCSASVLDSPNTTSATTYKTQFLSQNNTLGVYLQLNGSRSSITLMEISA